MGKENEILPIKADNGFELRRAVNKKILRDSGVTLLLSGLYDLVSDSDLYIKNQNVISTFKNADDWESETLIYMWGNPNDFNKKTPESLTLVVSVADKNMIHLKYRKVEQDGEIDIKNSVFDVSIADKKKEMLDEITSKFSGSLIPRK